MTSISKICHSRCRNLTAVLVSHQHHCFTLSCLETQLNHIRNSLYLFASFCLCYLNSHFLEKGYGMHSYFLFVPHFLPFFCYCAVQMEELIARMQDEKNGIPIRTVKSFLTKIPSVFSGKSPTPTCLRSPLFPPFWAWPTKLL